MGTKTRLNVTLAALCIVLAAFYYSCESPSATSNYPPSAPTKPTPPDGSKGVPADTALAWECSDPEGDRLSYFVRLGVESEPPLVAGGVGSPSYQPALFSPKPSTTYYWRVIADDSRGRTAGPIWRFKTGDDYCRHMPLDVGNTWTYFMTERSQDSEEPMDTIDAGVYNYEVTKHKGRFNKVDTYVVQVREDGEPASKFKLGHYGDKCFFYDTDHWDLFIEDDMALGTGNSRGLMTGNALTYTEDGPVNVPADSFPQCKIMHLHCRDSFPFVYQKDDYYWECYAPDVGLVYFRHYWERVTWLGIIPIVETGEVEYELGSYEVKKKSSVSGRPLAVDAPREGRSAEPLPPRGDAVKN